MIIDGKQLCPHNIRIQIDNKPSNKNERFCPFCGEKLTPMNELTHKSSIYCGGKRLK